MRELYAVELRARTSTNEAAQQLIDAWVDRHVQAESSATVTREVISDTSTVVELDQTDGETGTLWRSQIATGPSTSPAHATVRIGIRAGEGSGIAPLEYEFRTPAIVRTLLRELDVYDGRTACTADPGPEVGPSDVGDLIALLKDNERRLPVVVVSRRSQSGEALLDPLDLTRELAGLAHVRVFSSAHASWRLTEILGQPLSVFDGAVRVYFPGFTADDDRYRHRLFFPDRITDRTAGSLRSWMGSLAAAAIGEHPAYATRRDDRRLQLRQAIERDDADELREFVEMFEAENIELTRERDEKGQLVATLEDDNSRLQAEIEQLKYQFGEMERARAARVGSPTTNGDPLTVGEAVDRLEELARATWYATRVALSAAAVTSARAFANYNRPDELLRAGQAVLEAGALYHDNVLGEPPKDFFNRRGFGYGAQPSPHLKVDEATSNDQCLRIYWEDDPATRMWTITEIGFHR